MAIVHGPFFSVYAKGSVGHVLTVRRSNYNFVMSKFPKYKYLRTALQDIVRTRFLKRTRIYKLMYDHDILYYVNNTFTSKIWGE